MTNIVYTDGSCYPNPNGNGGWAYVVLNDGVEIRRCGGSEKLTTNNRMELTAILEALKSFNDGDEVEIISDSQYCVNSINIWIGGWQKKGFPCANADIMEELFDELKRVKVDARWIKAHNGNEWNEVVDEMSNRERISIT